jgi:NADH:ubiquinone oxidoreductase subunit 2 (subunit N)
MMMMAKGLDLLIVILGLEILSICIFVLVAFNRFASISNEASLKYFLMGAFATGFILYGTALFYGATGSTNVRELAAFLDNSEASNPLITLGFILMIGGIGFKLALAPFHAWAPDVYQGAPTPVAAWLSVAPKAATLIALARILSAVVPADHRRRELGPDPRRAGHRFDGGRQLRGHRSAGSEAHARLLRYRSRRLHDHRPGLDPRRRRSRHHRLRLTYAF